VQNQRTRIKRRYKRWSVGFPGREETKKRPKISILPICKHRHQLRVLENHEERKEEGERSSGGAVPVSARVW
jgi:hypothetical protein